jgi:hypothetical protein
MCPQSYIGSARFSPLCPQSYIGSSLGAAFLSLLVFFLINNRLLGAGRVLEVTFGGLGGAVHVLRVTRGSLGGAGCVPI